MLRSLSNNELMTVNGGFYYVPSYIYKYICDIRGPREILISQTTVQVPSGSGIKAYVNGIPQY